MSNGNGGGWGGWIVLLLVGAAVWFFFIQPNRQKDAHKDAVQQVLRADSRSTTNVSSVSAVVIRMRRIDLSKCPNDFKAAYMEHIHAWELLADVERDAIAFDRDFNSGGAMFEAFVRGLMLDPFGKAREATAEQNRLKANYQMATTEIRETFQRVERSGTTYGAQLSKRREPGYSWASENPDDTRVKWMPGSGHPEYPNVIASDKERNWNPAPGYKWVMDAPGDLRVVRR